MLCSLKCLNFFRFSFQIAYICDHTRDFCSRTGRELLSSIIQKHPTALSMLLRRVQGVMAELGKVLLLWPLQEIWVTLPRYSIAAARAARPIPVSVCSICLCLKSGTAAHVRIVNMHTDVDACDCGTDTVRQSALEDDWD